MDSTERSSINIVDTSSMNIRVKRSNKAKFSSVEPHAHQKSVETLGSLPSTDIHHLKNSQSVEHIRTIDGSNYSQLFKVTRDYLPPLSTTPQGPSFINNRSFCRKSVLPWSTKRLPSLQVNPYLPGSPEVTPTAVKSIDYLAGRVEVRSPGT
jgi:hypothetical protein